jgi:hypothetical protein
MKRIAAMFAVVFVVSLLGGCETCVPPGCEECASPCPPSHDSPCAWECTDDPCAPVAETRLSRDWIADLRSNDRAAREAAVDALARMGPSVLADVGVLLSDPDRNVRYSALQVFVRLREHAWTSVWYVKNRVSDPDAAIRADAVYVIGLSGASGAEAIPELISALNDPSPIVRYRAAVAFQGMDVRGGPGLAALERASRCDRDPRVREAANCAIYRIKKALSIC